MRHVMTVSVAHQVHFNMARILHFIRHRNGQNTKFHRTVRGRVQYTIRSNFGPFGSDNNRTFNSSLRRQRTTTCNDFMTRHNSHAGNGRNRNITLFNGRLLIHNSSQRTALRHLPGNLPNKFGSTRSLGSRVSIFTPRRNRQVVHRRAKVSSPLNI